MGGAIGIAVVLVIFPVVVLMTMGAVAMALGGLVQRDVDLSNAGSELLDTNY
jgi:hypothetical protein